jgi:molybdopterin synthase sulfur carrier subunit
MLMTLFVRCAVWVRSVDDAAPVTTTATQVLVRYFAAAAEAAGLEEERVAVSSTGPHPTVGELRAQLTAAYGEPMARVMRAGSFLVDGVVSRDDARLIHDRVDVLPPFAGG